MTLSLLEADENSWATPKAIRDVAFSYAGIKPSKEQESSADVGEVLTGALGQQLEVKAGEEKKVTFIISWYFPNVHQVRIPKMDNHDKLRYYYSKKFKSSKDVADVINLRKKDLISATKSWNKTWYDSSLPFWFLDRTFINTSTLATNSFYRFDDLTNAPHNEGRLYAMEGVYLGEGTCTHVFHYEQSLGRLFPNMARQLRSQIDFDFAWDERGFVKYRAEHSGIGRHDGRGYAIDGHAGTILRAYREHTMSADNAFLKKNWSKIKKGILYLIDQDKEKTGKTDGIIEGVQYNTLDRPWYGKIPWISTLYNACLRAGESMAHEMGDKAFAKICRNIASQGYKSLSEQLFNGEYFIQELDPEHPEAPNTNQGCYIDQILGEAWARQTNLPHIVPKEEAKSTLASIFKYNYLDDVGPYHDTATVAHVRYYALPGEPGVINCTFPKGGGEKAAGQKAGNWEHLTVGYFSENWTGLSNNLAGHMIAEGLMEEGLKVLWANHVRYAPEKRNPYNEIEYGNHYIRAMSSYAAFVSASGFSYHGPKGEIGFDPKINPENFKSAFVTAEGWGSFEQKRTPEKQTNKLKVNYGTVQLSKIILQDGGTKRASVSLKINGESVKTKLKREGNQYHITWKGMHLKAEDEIVIELK
ncbi:GH116 family glycosyl hydrolase [Fulvivirgaceae bacterium BMA10]|uniref:GH116 family glycosyl hydrolase n=1 Tax=Splendidivirga corallicola TaxID=3051826 RepID=A0ABT8KXD9_9BACT|nr:GH116 family glycosyl hydrolase [Fulvivirgaceae bacterium BMA10]